eukprot:CAMPEP_0113643872 /NCGR_PEP_ID=MMETSP0017_2-20120614/23079_1 /TAXON_ID=2856 /ORGANISM="Cylindrotheca closterium" /LENGTH=429 /DNA_ID=CAMNT_0000555431 /DNA_START=175 /DNA_END=1464 /DNA_ORIENTATION=+ /assembly_acc=CAM_ASM_000147
MESSAFLECESLTEVRLMEGLQTIGENAFEKCVALQTLEIPSTVVVLGRFAFNRCGSLVDVHLSKTGLVVLERSIFRKCTSLRGISLPPSIETIQYGVFSGCSSLVSVEFLRDSPVEICSFSFKSCKSLANVSVHWYSSMGEDSFLGCKRLEQQQGSAMTGRVVSSRFQEYPVHKKCLNASVTTVNSLRQNVQRSKVEDTSQHHNYHNFIDSFGMTPFHVLLSSATPRPDLLEVLLEEYPPAVLGIKDGRGKRAMDYLISSFTTESKIMMKATLDAWTLNRYFVLSNPLARNDMSRRIADVIFVWSGHEKDGLLRDLFTTQEGYESAENMSLLEMWLWKMALESFESTENQGHVDRSACRFLCGASFVIPVVIGFLGEEVEDSHSSYSTENDSNSSSSNDDGSSDEDYRDDDWSDYEDYNFYQDDWDDY